MTHLKRLYLPATILVIGTVVIGAIMATKPTPQADPDKLAEPPKAQVTVAPIVKQQVQLSAQSQGTVKAKRKIDLISQVSGVVTSVSEQMWAGQFFNAYQVLLQIDDRDYQAALTRAKYQLKQAQRMLAEEKGRARQAKQQWRDLGNKEANQLFLRQPQLAEAQAQVLSAQASVELAQLDVDRTRISVPFAGRVEKVMVNIGQYVSAGNVLAKVYSTQAVEVRLPLTDSQLALIDLPLRQVSDLKKLNQDLPQVKLSAIVAGEMQFWQGIITRAEAYVESQSRMYYAIAEVEQPFSKQYAAPLTPGLFVNAEITGKTLNNVVVLPRETVVKRSNLYTLNQHNEIQLQPVTVLRRSKQQVWLTLPDEQHGNIVMEKHAILTPGMAVEPLIADKSQQHKEAKDEVAVAQAQGDES
ncbi:efflux transporter periplasmic adaptor subunit [Saccharobesus litoralis]|uniref:Efflux transporter periplasmic adaptor subunit n=1 Tax=Saccharobesus litoralis TaxID=2172099 RepID=A0A2S0VM88_9ALTE|nr:efflux RND transporter periplasmic adaptor subunit [Saccharobesus litoralis]AWB65282.1 efflux transporter periplasmic adaptor subunit [Saccharobesus litoralis]